MTLGELFAEVIQGPVQDDPDVNFMRVEYDSLPQDAIPRIRGSPEGELAERIGYIVVDFETGDLWRKTTTSDSTTGWVKMTAASPSSGGLMTGDDEDPNVAGIIPDNPSAGALYYQQSGDGLVWHWQTDGQVWA